MKSKILLTIFSLLSFSAFAQRTAAEEAMILNQELQFLEDAASAAGTAVPVSPTAAITTPRTRTVPEESLENTYFDDQAESADSIRTRTAAPKRRGL